LGPFDPPSVREARLHSSLALNLRRHGTAASYVSLSSSAAFDEASNLRPELTDFPAKSVMVASEKRSLKSPDRLLLKLQGGADEVVKFPSDRALPSNNWADEAYCEGLQAGLTVRWLFGALG
jgi:hypothetical protein